MQDKYARLIRKLERYDQLLGVWEMILGGTNPWPAGKLLEMLILRAFEIERPGSVSYPYTVRAPANDDIIEQIDGFVSVDGIQAIVETKHTNYHLNVEALAKLRNQLARRPSGLVGCLFSYGGFTRPAIILASYAAPQAMLLWTRAEIDAALRGPGLTVALKIKYAGLLQHGDPTFDFRERYLDA
jgi:hypothetical protein